jgi:hypothetical protein
MPPSSANAHGSVPPVLAVAEQDDSGPLVLRLGHGLAQRRGTDWRFICSTHFQGESQDPAHALPGGGTAIGTPRGLWVLQRDGTLAPHPDPAAEVDVVAFGSSEAGLFALRSHGDLYDVAQVDADRVRVIFTETRYWSDLAVGEGFLQLVRYEGQTIDTLTLSLQGQVLAEERAMVGRGESPYAVYARPAGDMPYVVTGYVGAAYELGRVEQGMWRVLQQAGGNLAGPLQTVDGARYVALEGALARFDAETLVPLGDASSFVVALGRLGTRSYACTTDGVRDLGRDGLGPQRFAFTQLLPPDLSDLAGEQRADCTLEWQGFLLELRSRNIAVADPNTLASGSSPPAAGAGATAGTSQVPDAAPRAESAGPTATCAISPSRGPRRGGAAATACLALMLCLAVRRARHSRAIARATSRR